MENLSAHNFGRRARLRREQQQVSLRRVAARAGVSAGLLSQIENGHSTPGLENAERIAKTLGMTLTPESEG